MLVLSALMVLNILLWLVVEQEAVLGTVVVAEQVVYYTIQITQ
jgi:hypothetical protein